VKGAVGGMERESTQRKTRRCPVACTAASSRGSPGNLQGIEGPGKGDEGRIGGKVESFGFAEPRSTCQGRSSRRRVGIFSSRSRSSASVISNVRVHRIRRPRPLDNRREFTYNKPMIRQGERE